MDFLANAMEQQYMTVVNVTTDTDQTGKLEKEVTRLKEQLSLMRDYVKELEQDVDQDPLVNVYNRRAFMKELSRARSVLDRYGIESCVIYMDLDGFKAVNDVHGHIAGDELLKRVGEVVNKATRECDMVARLGGDEFAILLFKTGPVLAKSKATELAGRIADIEIGTMRGVVKTTASWGVATCTMSGSAEDILSLADQEMYLAKNLGRETQAG